MKLEEKTAFIFDMDGTLYSQTKMRIQMAFVLICYYGAHLTGYKELCSLRRFRNLRDHESYKSASSDEIIGIVSREFDLPPETVSRVIDLWMFQTPLKFIKSCAYEDVLCFIEAQYGIGKKIYIYSDYPALEKVKKLGIPYDRIFSLNDKGVMEAKPSKSAMEYVIKEINIPLSQLLYIGNRNEKDGRSAWFFGIDYMDVHTFRAHIHNLKR